MTNLANNDNFRDAVDKMVYWSKLFGVAAYIFGGFMVIAGLSVMLYGVWTSGGVPQLSLILGGIFYIIAAPLYLYPGKLLLNFSKVTRQALNNSDPEKFAEGFIPMGLHFKFLGVMTVIGFVLFGLIFTSVSIYNVNGEEDVGVEKREQPREVVVEEAEQPREVVVWEQPREVVVEDAYNLQFDERDGSDWEQPREVVVWEQPREVVVVEEMVVEEADEASKAILPID